MTRLSKRMLGGLGSLVVASAIVGVSHPRPVHADDAAEAAERRARCAIRLSVAILGQSPTADALGAPDPQARVDGMLGDPAFFERFARFVNAQFNPEPGLNVAEDASYTLAKYVLTNGRPWRDLCVGPYAVADEVTQDGEGLGYFRSTAWMRRYAGNEAAGYRVVAAYRILQNTTGLSLSAVSNVPGTDLTSKGREASGCAGCHYQRWYALDKVARVLSKRRGQGNNMTFTAPADGPQEILNRTVNNDKELVESLVQSENFKFNTCRLAFQFLYGRAESTCESNVFDACVDAFSEKGTMQAALGTIAKDATFCQ